MKQFHIFFAALVFYLVMAPACFSLAGKENSSGERVVVCMIPLEHADAAELAATLEPLLSPAGSIVPYRPTNTLIIKDRISVVEKLSIVIKGGPCNPVSNPSESEHEPGDSEKKSYLDQ